MKKAFCAIFSLILLLTAALCGVSFADTEMLAVTPAFVIPQEADYASLSPTLISADNAAVAYCQNGSIFYRNLGSGESSSFDISAMEGIESLALYGRYIFTVLRLGDTAVTRVFNTSDNTSRDVLDNAVSLCIDGDMLYTYIGNGYARYDLEGFNGTTDLTPASTVSKPFTATKLFTADGDKIFAADVNKINVISDTPTSVALNFTPTSLAADNGLLYLLTTDTVNVYSTADYSLLDTVNVSAMIGQGGTLHNITAFNSQITVSYSSTADGIAVLTANQLGKLTYDRLITTTGATLDRLNNPTSLVSYGSDIFVADSGNNRILQSLSQSLTANAPYKLAADGTYVYYADSQGLFACNKDTKSVVTVGAYAGITDMTVIDNTLYFATADTLFSYSQGVVTTVKSGAFSALCASKCGEWLYLVENNSICAISRSGAATLFSLPLSSLELSSTVMSVEADSFGNLYVLYSQDSEYYFAKLERQYNGFGIGQKIKIESVTPTDFAIVDNSVYFTSNAPHALCRINGQTLDESGIEITQNFTSAFVLPDYTASVPLLDEANIYKVTTNSYCLFATPDSYELAYNCAENTLLYSLTNDAYNFGGRDYYFVMLNGKTYYVPANAVTALVEGVPSVSRGAALFNNTVIYKYPDINSVKLASLSKGNTFDVTGDVCGYSNSYWYSVTIDGNVGYIKRADVGLAAAPVATPTADSSSVPVVKKYYAETIDENVLVYALADPNSTIINSLGIGAQVELLEPFNSSELFTYITYGEICGFVYTSSLSTTGLTPAQITALVIVAFAAVLIVIIRIASKKQD